MKPVTAFAAGGLFGVGLVVSQMTNANKVIGFLNVAGDWDPSLALVMVGAIGVHLLLYRVILKRESPLMDEQFRIPTRKDIDGRLIIGAGLFGVGWALGGYCPGPALASLPTLDSHAVVFVCALLVGMLGWNVLDWALSRSAEQPEPEREAEPQPVEA